MGVKTRKLSQINDSLIDWQAVITGAGSSSTAVSGQGYFINTTSAVHTLNLPASPVFGDTITITDYASTFATNNVTLNPNGNKIEGATGNGILSTNDQTHTLVYTDTTQGWKIVNQDTAAGIQPSYITATGGTVTTSGDYKIHTFTGDADFIVSSIGNPLGGPNTSDYVVVAGGGGGGGRHGGGGGAGGFRESKCNTGTWTASPLATPTGIALTAQTYPITVGAGGTGGNRNPSSAGTNGSNSVFSTITSTGGGKGYTYSTGNPGTGGQPGGSGGGGGHTQCSGIPGGSGNTPPVSPSQGNNGGNGFCGGTYDYQGGGGGGATVAGGTAPAIGGGDGGAGATSSINGTPTARAGGGGGGTYANSPGGPGSGGSGGGAGGGGPNASPTAATAGTANTGGGGGGYGGTNPGNPSPNCTGANGGSGVVIIRYKFQ
jgi:predicted secreted protein